VHVLAVLVQEQQPGRYFAATLTDAELRAFGKKRNDHLWEGDVFELFFKPADDRLMYYEFQVNALNTPLELFFPSRGAGGYQMFGITPAAIFDPAQLAESALCLGAM